MDDDKTEFHPYIDKLKAELLQFKVPEEQEENIFLVWLESAKPAADSEVCIKVYLWKRDRGLQLTDEQMRILEAYENKVSI